MAGTKEVFDMVGRFEVESLKQSDYVVIVDGLGEVEDMVDQNKRERPEFDLA
jgi:hypothetical protein